MKPIYQKPGVDTAKPASFIKSIAVLAFALLALCAGAALLLSATSGTETEPLKALASGKVAPQLLLVQQPRQPVPERLSLRVPSSPGDQRLQPPDKCFA